MAELFKPELESILPNWTKGAPKHVKAFFTCRTGGVSSGLYGGPNGIMGLNLALHTGDVKSCVMMNRSIVTQCCPSEPKWLTQVHGTTVLCADDIDSAQSAPEADAQWTSTSGVVACVMTADCLPVFIADRSGRIVAAVHAGWRSLADGILQRTVEEVRRHSSDLKPAVWLGPRIGADAFEVGEDVREAALESAGIDASDIADCGLSTYRDPKQFWSFRRDGERSGRHAALIWIDPKP